MEQNLLNQSSSSLNQDKVTPPHKLCIETSFTNQTTNSNSGLSNKKVFPMNGVTLHQRSASLTPNSLPQQVVNSPEYVSLLGEELTKKLNESKRHSFLDDDGKLNRKVDLIKDDWVGFAPIATPEATSELSSVCSRLSLLLRNQDLQKFLVTSPRNSEKDMILTSSDSSPELASSPSSVETAPVFSDPIDVSKTPDVLSDKCAKDNSTDDNSVSNKSFPDNQETNSPKKVTFDLKSHDISHDSGHQSISDLTFSSSETPYEPVYPYFTSQCEYGVNLSPGAPFYCYYQSECFHSPPNSENGQQSVSILTKSYSSENSDSEDQHSTIIPTTTDDTQASYLYKVGEYESSL